MEPVTIQPINNDDSENPLSLPPPSPVAPPALPTRGPLSRDPSRRCTAQRTHGRGQCRKAAIKGCNVCLVHGAGAPHVRRAARERLDSLVLPAIKVLRKAVKSSDKSPNDKDKQVLALKASIVILDRTGFGPKSTVEIEDNSGQPKINIEGLSDEAKRDILATLARHGVIGNGVGSGANGGNGARQLAGVSAITDGEVIDVTPRTPRESSYSSPLTDLMLARKSDEEPITLQSYEIAELPR